MFYKILLHVKSLLMYERNQQKKSTGHLCGKTLLVLETTVISISYIALWKGIVVLNIILHYFTLLVFAKDFVPLLVALKWEVREGYRNMHVSLVISLIDVNLVVVQFQRHVDPDSDFYFGI